MKQNKTIKSVNAIEADRKECVSWHLERFCESIRLKYF
jgi:hypothetical protein